MKNYHNLKVVIANYSHRFQVTEIKIPTAFLVAFEEVWVSKSYKTQNIFTFILRKTFKV